MSYYYLIIALQAFCVYHVINQRKDRWWIWIIIFLPVIGSLVYIASEVLDLRNLGSVQNDLSNIVNPGGRIKELEKQLEFSDTHQNRIALADAYLASGQAEKSIELYESSLTGLFEDDPHVNSQLISAYFHLGEYQKAIGKANNVTHNKDFQKSRARLHYALSLEQIDQLEAAEKELKALDTPYAGHENRIAYGQFLIRHHKTDKAIAVFEEIISEYNHLNKMERRKVRPWVNQAQEALNNLQKS